MEPFLGQIMLFAGNFAPRGWAFCNGQLMSIAQNTALFSLLGINYGGDGKVTFALPDLRGRVMVGDGTGPGLSPKTLGEMAGASNAYLLSIQMPMHNHNFMVSNTDAADATTNLSGKYLCNPTDLNFSGYMVTTYAPNLVAPAPLNPATLTPSGGSQPHNNMQPYLGLNYIIAIEGEYPARNN